jgi:hypothetical protein
MKMKTLSLRDWLRLLPEEISKAAFVNMASFRHDEGHIIAYSLGEALRQAFDWRRTHEGADYWTRLYREVVLMESDQAFDLNKFTKKSFNGKLTYEDPGLATSAAPGNI